MGMFTIFLSSIPLSVSYPSPGSSSSMASTPDLFMRRTRGLPRRDYNALHNGLISSPSQQSEGSTCETGHPSSPEPSSPRDLENVQNTPQSKRSYSLLSSSPSPLDPAFSESRSDASSPHPCKRRKPKSYIFSIVLIKFRG
ncbi:hypothetical protein BDQ94DRAFT_154955 [Aspergillus welwitschiae]|uniref:Uncharacterized protein n=2 Tax=Aspergillus welwitschiae TaxID=1341132 RepID=A0A3F3PJ69_9EURO|nr:hypothetical protein BDQ94DRAFT_154955 [Aspergillus welwitschiae]RDH26843.1 hypothetical protein BDQ94DRAFT_154955 [Aspergillus welwitschiae]